MRHCRAACADFTLAGEGAGYAGGITSAAMDGLERQPKQSAGFTVLSTYLVHVKKKLMG